MSLALQCECVGTVRRGMWALLGGGSVRFERRAAVVATILLSVCLPAYMVWKLVEIRQPDFSFTDYVLGPVAVACSFAFLVRVAVLVCFWRACRFFGLGLKDRLTVQAPDALTASLEHQSLLS